MFYCGDVKRKHISLADNRLRFLYLIANLAKTIDVEIQTVHHLQTVLFNQVGLISYVTIVEQEIRLMKNNLSKKRPVGNFFIRISKIENAVDCNNVYCLLQ